ncbi:MAG: hypothetical protein ACK56I_15905, partial [bacterium]
GRSVCGTWEDLVPWGQESNSRLWKHELAPLATTRAEDLAFFECCTLLPRRPWPNPKALEANKKPPPRRGLFPADAGWGIPEIDQPMAGAIRATGVASAAARSRGKL